MPPKRQDPDASTSGSKPEPPPDVVQKSIGTFRRYHIWITFIVFLVKFPIAWHQLSIVFLAPPMEFTCIDNKTSKCARNCSEHKFDKSLFTETIITQWDLVCDKAYMTSLTQTITMFGILCGSIIFGYLADRYGRRVPLAGGVLLQGVTGIVAAVSPWFPLFLFMRYLSTVATGGTMVNSFVILMELIGLKWRTVVGIVYQIPFNLGHLLLAVFAYYIRDWRWYQFALSAPSLILISYYWLLPESPRWLLTVGRVEKAIEEMEHFARRNRLPTEQIRRDVQEYMEKRAEEREKKHKKGGNIFDLVRTPIMRIYTLCIGFNWLVCGLCFYGSAQYIGQLGGNIFVNVAISAAIQIPGTLSSIFFVKILGRRLSLVLGNMLAGLSCLGIALVEALVPKEMVWLTTTLSSIDMFGLMISFPTVYIYSGELFPTLLRNVGVGTSSMFARVGSMLAPFVASLVSVERWIPPLIFGLIPIIGAILCMFLPETLNCKLPDTVEEAEQFFKQKRSLRDSLTNVGS